MMSHLTRNQLTPGGRPGYFIRTNSRIASPVCFRTNPIRNRRRGDVTP
jgi:hypothetical protein